MPSVAKRTLPHTVAAKKKYKEIVKRNQKATVTKTVVARTSKPSHTVQSNISFAAVASGQANIHKAPVMTKAAPPIQVRAVATPAPSVARLGLH